MNRNILVVGLTRGTHISRHSSWQSSSVNQKVKRGVSQSIINLLTEAEERELQPNLK